jgi:hypothetical protein
VTITNPKELNGLCENIGGGRQCQLPLLLSNEKLYLDDEWCEGGKTWITNLCSIPLTTILKDHKLKQLPRYLLSYFLARAVWQYYDTEWMASPWTKENVNFIFERHDSSVGIFLNEPFLSTRFEAATPQDDRTLRPLFPEICALGIMLLEIELGIVIGEEMRSFPECFGLDGTPVVDADLYTAQKLCKHPYKLEHLPTLLRKVIDDCVIPGKFNKYRTEITSLRKAMYKYIVAPLQELIKGNYDSPDPENVTLGSPTLELSVLQELPLPLCFPGWRVDTSLTPVTAR